MNTHRPFSRNHTKGLRTTRVSLSGAILIVTSWCSTFPRKVGFWVSLESSTTTGLNQSVCFSFQSDQLKPSSRPKDFDTVETLNTVGPIHDHRHYELLRYQSAGVKPGDVVYIIDRVIVNSCTVTDCINIARCWFCCISARKHHCRSSGCPAPRPVFGRKPTT